MKRCVLPLFILVFALPLLGQNFVVGGNLGLGLNVTDEFGYSDHNYDSREFLFGWYVEKDTVIAFRYGTLNPVGDSTYVDLDMDYLAVTVDYIFFDTFFNSGFFMGPAYYDGTTSWAIPFSEDRLIEDESQLGLMGGVESMIPLGESLDFTIQAVGHYLPFDDDEQVLMGITAGILFKF